MARIRTIKPEFPQSETVGRLSRDARLLFIQIWTIADDSGRLRGASRMLASLLYPYDDDAASLIVGWLDELDTEGCIIRYVVDGSSYIQISKWLEHQKIDRPSPSKIPEFDASSRALASPREPSTTDLGPGPRTMDKEERANALLSPDDPPTLDLVPTEPDAEQSAFDAYNAVAARVGIPLAQKFDQNRRSKIRQRLKDCGGLSGWVAALEKLEASSHCTGSNDRGWRADLDFLLQSQSFTRLMEGRYDDRKPKPTRIQPQSRVASDDEVRRRLFAAACG